MIVVKRMYILFILLGPNLVPDPTTTEGKCVADWRAKIDSIPAEVITYGVMLNPELHTDSLKIPKFLIKTKEGMLRLLLSLVYFIRSSV